MMKTNSGIAMEENLSLAWTHAGAGGSQIPRLSFIIAQATALYLASMSGRCTSKTSRTLRKWYFIINSSMNCDRPKIFISVGLCWALPCSLTPTQAPPRSRLASGERELGTASHWLLKRKASFSKSDCASCTELPLPIWPGEQRTKLNSCLLWWCQVLPHEHWAGLGSSEGFSSQATLQAAHGLWVPHSEQCCRGCDTNTDQHL